MNKIYSNDNLGACWAQHNIGKPTDRWLPACTTIIQEYQIEKWKTPTKWTNYTINGPKI